MNRNRFRTRRNKPRETKKININVSGANSKGVKLRTGDAVPIECQYKRSYSSATIAFMGRFKFGVKDQLIKIAKAFKVPAITSFSTTSGILVVDKLNRMNSTTIDKARQNGVVILTEEEFLYLISTNKNEVNINYEKV